jgi:hypothetical protein
MIELLRQMMKLPVVVFVSSFEMLARAMREIQHGFDRGVDVVVAEGIVPLVEQAQQTLEAASGVSHSEEVIAEKEIENMLDQDLGGDDLKLVRIRILFTKRDDEKILHHEEDLINYNTTPADFGGLRTCEYLKRHPGVISAGDEKYVTTFVEVIARYPKQEKEYDKEQVQVLREIRDKI